MPSRTHLLEELSEDKRLLIQKFRLQPRMIDQKIYWVRCFGNRPDHPYATHRAMRRCHIIELVFSFYDLCVAKMTYIRTNVDAFIPCKNDLHLNRLVPCPWWDMDCLCHRASGTLIDLRNLAEINDINVFRALCHKLENSGPGALRLVQNQ